MEKKEMTGNEIREALKDTGVPVKDLIEKSISDKYQYFETETGLHRIAKSHKIQNTEDFIFEVSTYNSLLKSYEDVMLVTAQDFKAALLKLFECELRGRI